MKKNKIILIICGLFFVAGIVFLILANNAKNYDNIKSLTVDELREKINNKDSFILVFTQDTCPHCKAYLPTINKIGKDYNITFYDISLTDKTDEELAFIKSVATTSGTPTTVFIVDGEEKSALNRLDGNVMEYRVVEKLKAMGYINE